MGFCAQLVIVVIINISQWFSSLFLYCIFVFFCLGFLVFCLVKVNKESYLSDKTNFKVVHQKPNIPFLPEPAAGCPTSPESLTERICSLDMEDKEKEDLCVGSLPQQRTKIQKPQNSVKPEDERQRSRPPD